MDVVQQSQHSSRLSVPEPTADILVSNLMFLSLSSLFRKGTWAYDIVTVPTFTKLGLGMTPASYLCIH